MTEFHKGCEISVKHLYCFFLNVGAVLRDGSHLVRVDARQRPKEPLLVIGQEVVGRFVQAQERCQLVLSLFAQWVLRGGKVESFLFQVEFVDLFTRKEGKKNPQMMLSVIFLCSF